MVPDGAVDVAAGPTPNEIAPLPSPQRGSLHLAPAEAGVLRGTLANEAVSKGSNSPLRSHRRGVSVQEPQPSASSSAALLPASSSAGTTSRRARASTLSTHAPPLDLVSEVDELSNPGSASAGTLRHSDPATRHLVSSLTKRSKTLADAVARRRESRSRSSSFGAMDRPTTSAPSSDSEGGRTLAPASSSRRRLTPTCSPTKPPNIPLPPLPSDAASRSRNSVLFGGATMLPSNSVDSARWDSLLDSAQQLVGSASSRGSCSGTNTLSASSTPINTPRTRVGQLPVPDLPLPPIPGREAVHKIRFAQSLDQEVVCESSDEDMLDDELSQMEHGLVQFQATFSASHRDEPSTGERQNSRARKVAKASSRFETPDSTPVLPSDPFTASAKQPANLLEVPPTAEADETVTRTPNRRSRDSTSTVSDSSAAPPLFELRSRGNSTSTKASSVDHHAPSMSRSLSQGSTLMTDSKRREATIPPRRNSLYIATPPIRMASLENLRGALQSGPEPEPVESISDTRPVEGSLGLSVDGPAVGLPVHQQPALPEAGPSRSVLLGSWLDDSLMKHRPAGTARAPNLGWLDDDDSEDSDGQRFVPVPVRRRHGRANSMDSSIFSLHESEVESIIDVARPCAHTPPVHLATPETDPKRPNALTPEMTPTSNSPLQPLLLPSESIVRSQRRLSSSQGISPQPYAGLQARCRAKMGNEGLSPQELLVARAAVPGRIGGAGSMGFGARQSFLGQLPPLGAIADGAARQDSDNQSVSSIAFSYAPTPPITPLRATAAGRTSISMSESPLVVSTSPDNTTMRPAVLGRTVMQLAPGYGALSPRVDGPSSMTRSSSANELGAPEYLQTQSQMSTPQPDGMRASTSARGLFLSEFGDLNSGRRPSAAPTMPSMSSSSAKMGKLRTTIFDSFGIKKGQRPSLNGSQADEMPAGWNERPTSPVDSLGSHSNNHQLGAEGSVGVLGSLMRRTSLTAGSHSHGNGNGSAGQSVNSGQSSAASSLSKARSHMAIASLSPASSPLKRTMKLPDPDSFDRPCSSSSSQTGRRERLPSAESQVYPHTMSTASSSREPSSASGAAFSKYSVRSGPPSSSVHGASSSSSHHSVMSSPPLDRSGKRTKGYGTSTMTSTSSTDTGGGASVKSGSSRGKKVGGSGSSSGASVRPVRKEEVARVNAVLAELQSAGFMAPPKKKKSSAGGSSKASSARSR